MPRSVRTGRGTADERPVAPGTAGLLTFTLRRHGADLARFASVADPSDAAELHKVLVDAIERIGGGALVEFELDVAQPGASEPLLTFVASRRQTP